jgi:hypothetical protein
VTLCARPRKVGEKTKEKHKTGTVAAAHPTATLPAPAWPAWRTPHDARRRPPGVCHSPEEAAAQDRGGGTAEQPRERAAAAGRRPDAREPGGDGELRASRETEIQPCGTSRGRAAGVCERNDEHFLRWRAR